jgi:hypothetical protein
MSLAGIWPAWIYTLLMQPVDNVSQVMQILRRQMAENLERLRGSGRLSGSTVPPTATSVAGTAGTLRQTAERRIKSIDPNDPRHLEKATHLFVESVLLAEFGEQLINNPEFRDLIFSVQSAMLADAELEGDLRRLVESIRRA